MSRLFTFLVIAVFLISCGGESTSNEVASQASNTAKKTQRVSKEATPKLPESAPIETGSSDGDFTARAAEKVQGVLEYEYFIEFTDEVNNAESASAKSVLEQLTKNYVFYLDRQGMGKVMANADKNQIADFGETHPCVVRFNMNPRPADRTNYEVVQVRLLEKGGKIYPNIGASAPIKSSIGVWDKKINFSQIKACQNQVKNCDGDGAKLAQNLMRAIFGVAYR